jgi:hypothetical protein
MYLCRKRLDTLDGLDNIAPYLGRRRKVRGAEPVMSNHAILVGIGDRPLFQRVHRLKRLLQGGRHLLEKALGEPHPANVQRESEFGDAAEETLISLP